jgi:hypothetical protein
MIEKCIAKFSRNHYRKKSDLKDTENYYKCLKQFDMGLFEEIGGNIQENENERDKPRKIKKAL